MTGHNQSLILQLLSNVTGSGARDLNPSLGEHRTSDEHEDEVDSGVDRIEGSLLEVQGRRHVISKTGSSIELRRTLTRLPDTEKTDEEVVRETGVKGLRDQEDVGAESRLQHDGHVGGVEEADGVRTAHATLTGGLDGDLNTEALEVDDSSEDEESRKQVHDVRQVLAIECLAQRTLLVGPCEQEMEERNDCTLEFRTTAGVDGGRGERLPHDRLADVGCDEERDTAAKAIALLQKLIEKDDNKTSNDELDNEKDTDASTEVAWLAIKTSQDVDASLAEGEDDSKELLGGLVELAVGLEVKVDINEVGTSKEL